MKRHVTKVAVLGSGVMGSTIAAQFANAGIPSLVLDILPPELASGGKEAAARPTDRNARNRLADAAVRNLLKARPAPLFIPSRISLIETGNLEDDLPRLAEADWVIEVVREEMSIKKKLLAEVTPHLRPDAVLSSNTSGLSLTEMAESLPEALRERFLGTHFFNPPRYMKLLELIPTRYTSSRVVELLAEFATIHLGKGVVPAKDTPNFIANRIGIHSLMATFRALREEGLTVEEVDALTGPAMARPKTATFRLADLVGVDVIALVAQNLGAAAKDECGALFEPPAFMIQMIERGLLGHKSGKGFYRKIRKPERKILTLDLETLEHRDPIPPALPELAGLARISEPGQRLRALVEGTGRGARAAWKMLAPTLAYSAMRVGEIAEDAETIDRAMRLGYNWELGPFEAWDALGFRVTTERLRADGHPLPPWVDALYEEQAESLYAREGDRLTTPIVEPGRRRPVVSDPRAVELDHLRRTGCEVRRNDSASLIDLGEGVLCLEFHSKMNAVDHRTIELMSAAADEAEANWQALVVANDGENFCAGADLKLLAGLTQNRDWPGIERLVRSFQRANDRLERCAVPVVIAPHGLALGGGCEIVLSGDAVRAAAESYVGLVEFGAGLLPAGGGCLRLYKRNVVRQSDGRDVYHALRLTFETIGMAKVSTSAEEALGFGFLRPHDTWSMNRAHLIHDAKQLALAKARAGYRSPRAATELPVMGRSGLALVETALVNMQEGRYISDYDRTIGRELGRVLAGGAIAGPTTVSEQHLLDLEVEGFLLLCGEPKTHERIEALLKTGKPLRN
jgi:3-hydroxyacyl-CoA dehydrogenase